MGRAGELWEDAEEVEGDVSSATGLSADGWLRPVASWPLLRRTLAHEEGVLVDGREDAVDAWSGSGLGIGLVRVRVSGQGQG